MNTFYNYLSKRLKDKLPGYKAQFKMAPKPNEGRRPMVPPNNNYRVGGVLLLLRSNSRGQYELLFTLRSNNLPTHRGQISFPGGRQEEGESIIVTALRETEEEVGIPVNDISVLGKITGLYIPNSNNYIYPVVGFIKETPNLAINTNEVAEAFFISLDDLCNPAYKQQEDWLIRNKPYKVPYWSVHRKTPLWGATAMILSEFIDLYEEYKILADKELKL